MGLGGENWEGGHRERALGIGREDMEREGLGGKTWKGKIGRGHGRRPMAVGGETWEGQEDMGDGRMDMGWEEVYGKGGHGRGYKEGDMVGGTWDREGRHGRENMGHLSANCICIFCPGQADQLTKGLNLFFKSHLDLLRE